MLTEEDIDFIDLERGPPPPLQRINTTDTEQLVASRKKLDSLLKADREKPLTIEEMELEFSKGSPESRQSQERARMILEDPIGRREEYFETDMEPWGQDEETTGGRRRTHRKLHYKKKTLRKRGKTNKKHKKRHFKRSTKRCRK